MNSDTLIDDILALVHKRETDLRGELARLEDVKSTLALNGREVETAPAVATVVRHRARRVMSAAQRKAVSKRMKALWRARRASKR